MNHALWQDACAMAARAHRRHKRKDGKTPYVSHVFRVALTVRHLFECDDDVCLAIALLHDTIEDTTIDHDDLLETFGAEVADGVSAMSKDMRLREDIREPAYDEALARADWRVRLVKLADTYDNWCDATEERKEKSLEKARRAIALAEPERSSHEPIDRAIRLMRERMGL
ncbi:MAG: HD domain-containing protein [Planctomycetota bacterium]|jgi:guanosine-3',5'-bis(diphosphate) 3'-pyrophosphohydrolase